ncbi:hypothetical protein [Paenibacillus sp. LPE1-1-1.1]|uniref:hypothetical protein n=1 Tax=Paenibacillus sp. LPE1-1-1.1 TaxID=3135230 RepID=UPI00342103BC
MNVYNRLKRFEWFRNRLIRNKITHVHVPLIIIPLVGISARVDDLLFSEKQ